MPITAHQRITGGRKCSAFFMQQWIGSAWSSWLNKATGCRSQKSGVTKQREVAPMRKTEQSERATSHVKKEYFVQLVKSNRCICTAEVFCYSLKVLSTRHSSNSTQEQKGRLLMDQAYVKRLVQLEARMSRMEAMMQALLIRLDINPADITPPEPPEIRVIHDAIRAALMMG